MDDEGHQRRESERRDEARHHAPEVHDASGLVRRPVVEPLDREQLLLRVLHELGVRRCGSHDRRRDRPCRRAVAGLENVAVRRAGVDRSIAFIAGPLVFLGSGLPVDLTVRLGARGGATVARPARHAGPRNLQSEPGPLLRRRKQEPLLGEHPLDCDLHRGTAEHSGGLHRDRVAVVEQQRDVPVGVRQPVRFAVEAHDRRVPPESQHARAGLLGHRDSRRREDAPVRALDPSLALLEALQSALVLQPRGVPCLRGRRRLSVADDLPGALGLVALRNPTQLAVAGVEDEVAVVRQDERGEEHRAALSDRGLPVGRTGGRRLLPGRTGLRRRDRL